METTVEQDRGEIKDIVESIPCCIYSVEYTKNSIHSLYHSPQCEIITGYTPDEYSSDPDLWFKMIFHKDRDFVVNYFADIQKMKQRKQIEHRIINKTGSIVWVSNCCSVSENNLNNVTRLDGLIMDITEKKEMERNFHKLDSLPSTIFDSIADGIVVTNLDEKIVFVNSRFSELWGAQVLGVEISNVKTLLAHMENKVADGEIFQKYVKEVCHNINREFCYNMELKNGNIQSINVIPHFLEGKFIGRIWSFQDISKSKKVEKLLIEAKSKAEETNNLKDKFVSLISHDLSSPLSSILGFLKFIDSDSKNPLCIQHQELFSRAMGSCNHLILMINELLSLNRLQTGRIVLKKKFVTAHYIIDGCVQQLDYLANAKGVKIVNNLERNTRIYADMNLIWEAIQNLIVNAIKFSNNGDSVTISTESNNSVTIMVKDTGTGISEQMLPDLFKPEIKTSTQGTNNEKGSGLGLPYCHEIVQAHNGSLTVESRQGEGSTFYLSLPKITPKLLFINTLEIFSTEQIRDLMQSEAELLSAKTKVESFVILNDTMPQLVVTLLKKVTEEEIMFLEELPQASKIKQLAIIVVMPDECENKKIPQRVLRNKNIEFYTKNKDSNMLFQKVKRFAGLFGISAP